MNLRQRIYTNETITGGSLWSQEVRLFSKFYEKNHQGNNDDMSSISSSSHVPRGQTPQHLETIQTLVILPKEIEVPSIDATPSWLLESQDEEEPNNEQVKESQRSDLTIDSLPQDDDSLPPCIHQRGTIAETVRSDDVVTVAWNDDALSHVDKQLLGERKRLVHRRVPSNSISVGSLVGQSSLITYPTLSTGASAASVRTETSISRNYRYRRPLQDVVEEGDKRYQRRRKPNRVVAEIKYLIGRVTKPIAKLTEKQPSLKRSDKGCLT